MEHERLRDEKPRYWPLLCARRLMAKYRFEAISGDPCYLLRYSRFSIALLEKLKPELLIFSGHNTDLAHYESERIQRIQTYFQNPLYPTFCICGSFQLMAQAFGANVAPIGDAVTLDPDFQDPIIPNTAISENGFLQIQMEPHLADVFSQLDPTLEVFQHHFWEVKTAPRGFKIFASSEVTPIQGILHESLPLAGVQFHPEDYDKEHLDGKKLIEAVIRWARSLNSG